METEKNKCEKSESKTVMPIINGEEAVFHVVMDINKLGLSPNQAMIQDMAEEYAVVQVLEANAGIIVYAKYNGKWIANPWSTRFLIVELLDIINTQKNCINYTLSNSQSAKLALIGGQNSIECEDGGCMMSYDGVAKMIEEYKKMITQTFIQ